MKSENVSSLIVVQMPSGEFLALPLDQFEEARALGQRVVAPAAPAVNDSHEEPLLTEVKMRLRDVRVGPDGAVYVLSDSGGGLELKTMMRMKVMVIR